LRGQKRSKGGIKEEQCRVGTGALELGSFIGISTNGYCHYISLRYLQVVSNLATFMWNSSLMAGIGISRHSFSR